MLSVSDAIKCKVGVSTGTLKDKDCGDAVKVCLNTTASVGGSSVTQYACGLEGQKEEWKCSFQNLNVAGVETWICLCKTDLCNRPSKQKVFVKQ